MISQIPNIEIFIKSVRVLFVYLLPKQSDWLKNAGKFINGKLRETMG
jgi:hypothetical protein